MKLKFYAREDLLVREAGVAPRIGQAARYYGRTFDPATRAYPATREAIEVEAGSEDGEKCARQCRKRALWAADSETAAAIGVEFVDTEFKDGAHTAKRSKPEPAPKAAKEAS
jgi:hypothetical protein